MIVSASDDQDLFGSSWNARTRIHEYGGSPALAYDGFVYFSNIADGSMYMIDVSKKSTPVAMTPSESRT